MAQADQRNRDGRIERRHDCETRLADVTIPHASKKGRAMLDDSKGLQLVSRILTLIHEEDLPRQEAEDILPRALGMWRAWHSTKRTG